jgi:RNA polymerase sigma-70 factor (ECF subfamily)
MLAEGSPVAGALAAWSTLESTLQRHLDATRLAWPELAVTPARLLRALADRVPAAADPCEWLERVHATDVYLAQLCATGDAVALAAFDSAFLPEVGAYIARTDSSSELADEVRQLIRHRLFVIGDDGGAPRIATYSGRGPLGAWLRMIAVRTVLNLRRDREAEASTVEKVGHRSPAPDPELDYIKLRYRPVFREVLEASLTELPAPQRNILRLYFIDGLTMAEIGRLYRVHESTIARQMAKIRRDVLATTRRLLVERHELASAEVDSFIALAPSQLDLSLSRILKMSKP